MFQNVLVILELRTKLTLTLCSKKKRERKKVTNERQPRRARQTQEKDVFTAHVLCSRRNGSHVQAKSEIPKLNQVEIKRMRIGQLVTPWQTERYSEKPKTKWLARSGLQQKPRHATRRGRAPGVTGDEIGDGVRESAHASSRPICR